MNGKQPATLMLALLMAPCGLAHSVLAGAAKAERRLEEASSAGLGGRRLQDLTGVPAPDEGDDGVLEGLGEGSGAPAPDEGADGDLEGLGEGSGAPAPDEGEDGEFEGNAEGAALGPDDADAPVDGDAAVEPVTAGDLEDEAEAPEGEGDLGALPVADGPAAGALPDIGVADGPSALAPGPAGLAAAGTGETPPAGSSPEASGAAQSLAGATLVAACTVAALVVA